MQFSLTKIDGGIDAVSFRMDRLSEHLDKLAEFPDMIERSVSEVEDEQVTTSEQQKQLHKALSSLQAKTEDLETCSCKNNLHIVGLAESTNLGNMEKYVSQLFIDLMGCETFSDIFMVERAYCSFPIA
ncbi:hypothetical protein NDU88_001330 [Pleurodeles waltl]|uniref:Uncharacterized protein n=1 Tax=Pleurodeles waltl TaxID=8319 RepID=A0AAV7NAR6_PLEWA|nr:hypothetical protein NDU88_001330 [Pleurodeles waltl]